jgi:hypothetical protein
MEAAIDGVAESEQADERVGESQSASTNNRGLTRKPRISKEPLKKRRKNRDRKSKNPPSHPNGVMRHALFRRITVWRNEGCAVPRRYEDYTVSVNDTHLPHGVTLEHKVG